MKITEGIEDNELLRICLTCDHVYPATLHQGGRILELQCDLTNQPMHYNDTCPDYKFTNQCSIDQEEVT